MKYLFFSLAIWLAGGSVMGQRREDSLGQQLQLAAGDRWYKNSLIYNLDVHTFQDSDGDGIGDFPGLTGRLLYLKSLGVDVIWLSPFQPSPHRDDGYDITDYYGIDSGCGKPGDFAEFMYRAHALGLRVIMDIVFDHSSDRHPWFLQAAADTSSPKHRWYVWSGDRPANQNKGMAFPGVQKEVWTWQPLAHEYYYHRFYDFQPHLNFINPEVQAEAQRILSYWLSQGMDGFRLDAVPFIVEIPNKVSDKAGHAFTLITSLRQYVQWRKGDALLLGEANVMPNENSEYFGQLGEGLHMMFNFYGNQYLFYGFATGQVGLLRKALTDTRNPLPVSQWAWFLRNHDEIDLGRLTDQQRATVYQQFGPDKNMQLYGRGIRRRLAPMLHNRKLIEMAYSVLFSLPGAPAIRYGEELGMGDDLSLKERLSVRTPMQWTHERNAGFSSAAMPIRPLVTGEFGYEKINVQDEDRDQGSLLNHIRRLARLRKECPEIGLGNWSIIDSSSAQVLVLEYVQEGRRLLIIHNFGNEMQQISIPFKREEGSGLRDLMTGEELKVDSERISLKLEGYGYKWYRYMVSP